MSDIHTCRFGHYSISIPLDLGKKCQKFGLSPREKQALFYLATGNSGPQTCEIMKISQGTLDTYRKRIFRKLGVKTIAEAVALNIAHMSGLTVTQIEAA